MNVRNENFTSLVIHREAVREASVRLGVEYIDLRLSRPEARRDATRRGKPASSTLSRNKREDAPIVRPAWHRSFSHCCGAILWESSQNVS